MRPGSVEAVAGRADRSRSRTARTRVRMVLPDRRRRPIAQARSTQPRRARRLSTSATSRKRFTTIVFRVRSCGVVQTSLQARASPGTVGEVSGTSSRGPDPDVGDREPGTATGSSRSYTASRARNITKKGVIAQSTTLSRCRQVVHDPRELREDTRIASPVAGRHASSFSIATPSRGRS